MNSEQPVDSASGLIKVGWFGVFLVIALSIYSAFVQRPAIASDVGTYLLATATSNGRIQLHSHQSIHKTSLRIGILRSPGGLNLTVPSQPL